MNKAILSTLNYRILIVIVETILVFILYKQYEIYIEVDFFIFSIAIVFPLVFSITSAYQRRQEAIMIFSEFRNKIIDTSNILYAVNGIHKKDYDKIFTGLIDIQQDFIDHLKNDKDINNFQRIRQKRKNIFKEIISYKDLYNEREKDSLIATKNEIFLCMEKLNGLKLHSTPVSLRRYCLIFIYLSPFLFNTKLITEGQFEMSLGIDLPVSILFSITISFILIALYNIQDYIENPFDQKGLDDLQIDQMQIFEKESLYE